MLGIHCRQDVEADVVADLLLDVAFLGVSILVSTLVEGVMMICSYGM